MIATRPGRRRGLSALAALVLGAGVLSGCAQSAVGTAAGTATGTAPSSAARTAAAADVRTTPPTIDLGKGLLYFPGPTQTWVAEHPDDPRTPLIARRIASNPANLWLTGDESFGNLREAVRLADAGGRTMLLTLYNVPGRDDGLSAPSELSLNRYKAWVNKVASLIGRTRAIVVLEPDSLWFYDRLPSDQARATRLAALKYAIDRLHTHVTRTRVYVDAGTSSGSVTPARMAALLAMVGVTRTAGYAVDVSSYAPTSAIEAYAQAIRRALIGMNVQADPRYVVDTGRNGAQSWDNNWCNPPQQRLGVPPRLVRAGTGLDLDLWVKAPGTSDGDCGPVGGGAGTYGGEFLPDVAYRMIAG